jgi:hypothetical protein
VDARGVQAVQPFEGLLVAGSGKRDVGSLGVGFPNALNGRR